MPKSLEDYEVVGVRLNSRTKQHVAKNAAILGVATSSFIRMLIRIGLDQVEKDPAILLKRSDEVGLPASN
jgi:hypothetical protein